MSKKNYQRKAAAAATVPELVMPDVVSLAMGDIAGAMREGLLAMTVSAGLAVMDVLMAENVTALCGPKGRHDPGRVAVRHGEDDGSIVLGGRRVPVRRPRVRTADRAAEMPVPAYELFSRTELLDAMALERMMAKLSTRRYRAGLEPVGDAVEKTARSTSRSAVSVAVGLRVMNEMVEAEVIDRVGPKHARLPERTAVRHASAPGSVVLGGRRVPVSRPRARGVEGDEVQLATYATFASDDLLTRVVMERMLAGVATRRHRAVAEPVSQDVTATSTSTSRSAVSRRFKTATTKTLDELMARDLGELAVAAMMIDGVFFAEQCCVVALAICADGSKVPVGLWLGDTENKTVVTHLLADLSARGLDASGGILFVLDGAKALHAGVTAVFDRPVIQRCQLHYAEQRIMPSRAREALWDRDFALKRCPADG